MGRLSHHLLLPLLLLTSQAAFALSVNQDKTPIRAGCDPETTVLAELPNGTELTLRYVMSADTALCYKVIAKLNGRTFEGYVPAERLNGLDEVNQSRKQAGPIRVTSVNTTERNQPLSAITGGEQVKAGKGISKAVVGQAQEALENQQPSRALAILEPELTKHKDPGLFALAGYAAFQADDTKTSIAYLRASLAMEANPKIEAFLKRVENEQTNDQSGDKLFGLRVVLRFDPKVVPAETARQMLTVVDRTYELVSMQLGCRSEERIVTIIQGKDGYRNSTGAVEWSGGLFDGRIHVPAVSGQMMNSESERTLAHETTHACLALLGQWPAWLHEGLAQKLSGDTLSKPAQARIQQMASQGKLPKLEQIGDNWSRLNSEQAAVAYTLALAAAEQLYAHYGTDGVRNLIKNPERLTAISRELDGYLGL